MENYIECSNQYIDEIKMYVELHVKLSQKALITTAFAILCFISFNTIREAFQLHFTNNSFKSSKRFPLIETKTRIDLAAVTQWPKKSMEVVNFCFGIFQTAWCRNKTQQRKSMANHFLFTLHHQLIETNECSYSRLHIVVIIYYSCLWKIINEV